MTFSWTQDTSPFAQPDGAQPARVVLRQVSDTEFELEQPFRYDGGPRLGPTVVEADYLGTTDLASVPAFLDWIARPFGRHTPAALLHDQLITDTPERLPEAQRIAPQVADLVFRDAMLDCGARILQTWIMWAGVTLRTRFHRGPLVIAGIVLWFAAALAGTATLVVGIATGTWWMILVAVLAPMPFSLLWAEQWTAGLIAGYSFWIVVLGFAPSWVAYQLYRIAELVVQVVAKRRPVEAKGGAAPAPPSFAKR
ncbi:MAG TPA: DUF1353 domain-containing protein [Acidimicrobiales bacterium]|nr:DUF1353 domain-containing protein [Acidimicrobiales bacterium]